jgi:HAD superfamily hydrolase (TIGR01509 family)
MKLGIITNAANAANANRLIDRNGLREYFDVIVISAEERIRKPDARIYARALERMQLPAASALMVGDSLTADVWGAQNAGLRAVWIKRELPFTKNYGGTTTPNAVITSLAELPLLPLL